MNQRVNAESISAWQQIFDSFGLEPEAFVQELQDIGDMKKLHHTLEVKRSRLAKNITQLEKKKSWLENEAEGLKSEISNRTEFGKKNLKEIAEHAESQIDNTASHTKKSLDDLAKQNQIQINLARKRVEEYFLNLVSNLENLLKHSHKAEHSLGQMESLKPLFDLINGKFDPAISISQIVIILDKLYVNIKNTDHDKHLLSSDIKRLREKLLDLISHE